MLYYFVSVDCIVKAINESPKGQLCVFYKLTDKISVDVASQLIKDKIDISFISYGSKDDLLINLGVTLARIKESDTCVLLYDSIPVSREIKKAYKIQEKRTSASRNGAIKKNSQTDSLSKEASTNLEKKIRNIATCNMEAATKTAKERNTDRTPTARGPKSQTGQEKRNVETAESQEEINLNKQNPAKPIAPTKKENKPVAVIKRKAPTSTPTLRQKEKEETVLTPEEAYPNKTISKDFKRTDNNTDPIHVFILRMGVRVKDISFKGTDEELAKKIAAVYAHVDDRADVLYMLTDEFGETAAETIYSWTKGNYTNLVELAKKIDDSGVLDD